MKRTQYTHSNTLDEDGDGDEWLDYWNPSPQPKITQHPPTQLGLVAVHFDEVVDHGLALSQYVRIAVGQHEGQHAVQEENIEIDGARRRDHRCRALLRVTQQRLDPVSSGFTA